jgi:hypothetical protein
MWDYLFIVAVFTGIAFAHWAPVRIKWRHVRTQDRLIERCRAHYLLALERLRLGKKRMRGSSCYVSAVSSGIGRVALHFYHRE